MNTQQKESYTIKEVAEVLGCGLNKTYDLVKEKKITSWKIGKKIMVSRFSLNRFIER